MEMDIPASQSLVLTSVGNYAQWQKALILDTLASQRVFKLH